MHLSPAVLAGLMLAASPPAPAQTPRDFASGWKPVAEFFHTGLDRGGVVGGSLWFLRGDSVLAREFHGLADLATGRRVDGNTIFHRASITKTFTAIAIMLPPGSNSYSNPGIIFLAGFNTAAAEERPGTPPRFR